MLNLTSARIVGSLKYAYVLAFAVVLARVFYPIVTGTDFEHEVAGILVILMGMVGGILVYRHAAGESENRALVAGGFALIGLSIYLIYLITGRA